LPKALTGLTKGEALFALDEALEVFREAQEYGWDKVYVGPNRTNRVAVILEAMRQVEMNGR
jgi:hypothetical protein